jgi:hypothetical protein
MSLEVDDEIERTVRQRAADEGLSVNDLLARAFQAASEAGPSERVRGLLAQWQSSDVAGSLPTARPGAARIFDLWRELDAAMTDDERAAEDRLWEDVQRGLDATRAALDMRPLSG